MQDLSSLEFVEDAITDVEVWGASPRFIAFRSNGRITFRLATDHELAGELMCRDEILHLLSEQLERGLQVQVANS